jgi:hypothetical protein
MNDDDVDRTLDSKARAVPGVDPALVKRIASSITASLAPAPALPPVSILTAALLLICAVVAAVGAARAGFGGVEKLSLAARVLIFMTLALLACATGAALVREFIPGSRRRVTPPLLVAAVVLVLLAVFGLTFRDPHTDHFFSAGLTCLTTGLLHALPAGFLAWLLLRRGYAVNIVTASLLTGVVAGLAGLTMLELHCTNFQASHVLVWHTAVVPTSAVIGGALAWALSRGGMT